MKFNFFKPKPDPRIAELESKLKGYDLMRSHYADMTEHVCELEDTLKEASEKLEASHRNTMHFRDKAIQYNNERNTLQDVMAIFAEKLFSIVPEYFADLWVLGDDGNHYHPLNYFIHVHDMWPEGGVDLRLDGFVVEMNIPTVEHAKQLAIENYRKVREFNP